RLFTTHSPLPLGALRERVLRVSSPCPVAAICVSPQRCHSGRSEKGSRFGVRLTRWKGLADAIQHAVDELDRTRARKAPRDLQRLVDHGSSGSFRVAEEFVQSHAQDVSVNGCHALQTPVFSLLANQ